MERKLRLAQAEDALVEIRKQCRIVQGLWLFKKINISGMGNRPNIRMLSLYNRINYKIECAAQQYCTAWSALLVLDPNGTWKDCLKELQREHMRGPGRDPSDTKTGNGYFEPSWIWLTNCKGSALRQSEDEFNNDMRVEWVKMRARVMKWQEEFEIIQEEMRHVLLWFEWKASWWDEQRVAKIGGDPEVRHGASAYASKQTHITRCMAACCMATWLPELHKQGTEPLWGEKYSHTTVHHNSAMTEGNDLDLINEEDVDMEETTLDEDDCDDEFDDFFDD